MLRFFRLTLMIVTLLVAAAAQLIFDRGALSLPIPAGMVDQFPWLAQAFSWRAGNHGDLALWAALTAGLLFGLAAPNWPIWQRGSRDAPAGNSARSVLPAALAAAACGMALSVALLLALGMPEATWMHWAWLGSAS